MTSVIEFHLHDSKGNRKLELRNFTCRIVLKKHRIDNVVMTMSHAPTSDFLERKIERTTSGGFKMKPNQGGIDNSVVTVLLPDFIDTLELVQNTLVDAGDKSCVFKKLVMHNFLNQKMMCNVHGLHDTQGTCVIERKGVVDFTIEKVSAHSLDINVSGSGSVSFGGVSVKQELHIVNDGSGVLTMKCDGAFEVLKYCSEGDFTASFKPYNSMLAKGPREAQFDLMNGSGVSDFQLPIGIIDVSLYKRSKNFFMNNSVGTGQVDTDSDESGQFIVETRCVVNVVYREKDTLVV